jgi:hypothetical protein
MMMIYQQSFVTVVWVAPVFHILEIPGSSLHQKLVILTEVSNDFPQSLQTNILIVGLPQIEQRPFPSTSFPVHYSPLNLLFDALRS